MKSNQILTDNAVSFLNELENNFGGRRKELLQKRVERQEQFDNGERPDFLEETKHIREGDWKVHPVPEDLQDRRVEITGPVDRKMIINALNSGAKVFMADFEDSNSPTWENNISGQINLRDAIQGDITFYNEYKDKTYKLNDDIATLMVRPRGLHLDEHDVTIDGIKVPAALLGTALTLFYSGQEQAALGQGIYFYLPKLESAEEVGWYRDVFEASQASLPRLRHATIRGIILIESLPAVYQMEAMLHALGPYAAGLNAARWDLKASILEYIMSDPKQVWPDRYGVDIKTTPFLANMFRRLVAVCLKHGAVPIGGMATALPSADEEVNRMAAASIKADKEWEAAQGFIRGWVAHIYHMREAAQPFKDFFNAGQKPSVEMTDPDQYPIALAVPDGVVTVEGTRRNIRTILEYLEGWLLGRGAKGIDSLEGKAGVHPALMEDLATARRAVAQTAQRVIHRARAVDTEEEHSLAAVSKILDNETEDILNLRNLDPDGTLRYRKARAIALHWIKSYTNLEFRSLGSYTRS